VSSDMERTVARMDVRGKHLFAFFLDPERLFVVGCEQAFGTVGVVDSVPR